MRAAALLALALLACASVSAVEVGGGCEGANLSGPVRRRGRRRGRASLFCKPCKPLCLQRAFSLLPHLRRHCDGRCHQEEVPCVREEGAFSPQPPPTAAVPLPCRRRCRAPPNLTLSSTCLPSPRSRPVGTAIKKVRGLRSGESRGPLCRRCTAAPRRHARTPVACPLPAAPQPHLAAPA